MKKIKISIISFMVVLVFASPASAVTVTPDNWNVANYNGNENSFQAVQVTGMYKFDDPTGPDNATVGETNLLPKAPYGATGRAAFFIGNDTGNEVPLPSINIGQTGDGLLNGNEKHWDIYGSDDQYKFDGFEFISDLQDVDGINGANDPGWIYLGKQEGDKATFDYATIGPFGEFKETNIGGDDGLIDIFIDWKTNVEDEIIGADWSLTPKEDILGTLGPLLGNNYFDHLAIVLKSSSYLAVYDLDFNKIFALEEGLTQEYFVPVKLTGTLNNNDFPLNRNGKPQAISHISLWAHDPVAPPQVVPEPATLILLGSGLAGLATMGIRRKKNS